MKEGFIIEQQDFNQLINKIEHLEGKIDALYNSGVGNKQLYTIQDACELLKVSKRTLQKYRDQGMLGFSQIADKIYFQGSDIQKFLNGHRCEAFKTKKRGYAN